MASRDPDLARLREEPEFKRLLGDLERKNYFRYRTMDWLERPLISGLLLLRILCLLRGLELLALAAALLEFSLAAAVAEPR